MNCPVYTKEKLNIIAEFQRVDWDNKTSFALDGIFFKQHEYGIYITDDMLLRTVLFKSLSKNKPILSNIEVLGTVSIKQATFFSGVLPDTITLSTKNIDLCLKKILGDNAIFYYAPYTETFGIFVHLNFLKSGVELQSPTIDFALPQIPTQRIKSHDGLYTVDSIYTVPFREEFNQIQFNISGPTIDLSNATADHVLDTNMQYITESVIYNGDKIYDNYKPCIIDDQTYFIKRIISVLYETILFTKDGHPTCITVSLWDGSKFIPLDTNNHFDITYLASEREI